MSDSNAPSSSLPPAAAEAAAAAVQAAIEKQPGSSSAEKESESKDDEASGSGSSSSAPQKKEGAKTIFDDATNFDVKHPLYSPWTMWFDSASKQVRLHLARESLSAKSRRLTVPV